MRQQIVGDCQHIMSEDPRRIFIYGVCVLLLWSRDCADLRSQQITIEDKRLSVWYFSRSHSTKTISFDWLSDEVRAVLGIVGAFPYS